MVVFGLDMSNRREREREDIKNKESYVSNHDELAFLVTPLSDASEDRCFDPGGDINEIDAFLDIDVSTNIDDGYHDSKGDIIYLKSFLINDTIPNLPPEVFLDHDPRSLSDINDLKSMVKVFDLGILEKIIFSHIQASVRVLFSCWKKAWISLRSRSNKVGRKNQLIKAVQSSSQISMVPSLSLSSQLFASPGDYEMWKLRIEQYFQVQDYALWDVIENGNSFKLASENCYQLAILDLDTMSIDDLYNNFKIVKQEVKRTVTTSSSSGSQNMAFLSSPGSTNEVDTANIQVSDVSTPVSTVSTHENTANLRDATMYAFLANQPNGSQLVHKDLEQIHEDDLEEISPRNQESRSRNQDNSRKTVNVEDTSSKAMVAIYGAGFDWSYMANDEAPTNMALLAFSDSEVQNSGGVVEVGMVGQRSDDDVGGCGCDILSPLRELRPEAHGEVFDDGLGSAKRVASNAGITLVMIMITQIMSTITAWLSVNQSIRIMTSKLPSPMGIKAMLKRVGWNDVIHDSKKSNKYDISIARSRGGGVVEVGMVGQRGDDEDVGGCGVLPWWWRLRGVAVVRGDDVGFGGGVEMMKI
uniref:Reverse transcriptase domain, reverse transcriptase zinc-binding domain protein n=1 Tax=Tanacetum cinerariifolium TaxID=118510 RepID=A0A6L2J1F3_TANCI|nr:reverse transcriptase domain, reverse transcriptase zinc-binding domain protein [Tanacetum cinerariifolium]